VRKRGHEGALGVLHQPLHLPLVIALARAANAIPEQEMANQFGEGAGAGSLAIAQDARHRPVVGSGGNSISRSRAPVADLRETLSAYFPEIATVRATAPRAASATASSG